MRDSLRFALCAVLALMQMLAPWVHAHTGVETGRFLHLPGLEFLAGTDKGCAAADAQPDGADLIVGLQAGPCKGSESIRPAPERLPQPYPPPASSAVLPRLPAADASVGEIPPPCLELLRHDARPRAPPSSTS